MQEDAATIQRRMQYVLHAVGDRLKLADDTGGRLIGRSPLRTPGNIKGGRCCAADAAHKSSGDRKSVV